jgi:hypothetical protein
VSAATAAAALLEAPRPALSPRTRLLLDASPSASPSSPPLFVKAAVEGRLPYGFTASSFSELPILWEEQLQIAS